MENVNIKAEELNKLISDVAQIKKMLMEEKEKREIKWEYWDFFTDPKFISSF